LKAFHRKVTGNLFYLWAVCTLTLDDFALSLPFLTAGTEKCLTKTASFEIAVHTLGQTMSLSSITVGNQLANKNKLYRERAIQSFLPGVKASYSNGTSFTRKPDFFGFWSKSASSIKERKSEF
jgi:hypothetical protein